MTLILELKRFLNTGNRSKCNGLIIFVAWDKLFVLTRNDCFGVCPNLGKIVKVVVLLALFVCIAIVATVPSGVWTSSITASEKN